MAVMSAPVVMSRRRRMAGRCCSGEGTSPSVTIVARLGVGQVTLSALIEAVRHGLRLPRAGAWAGDRRGEMTQVAGVEESPSRTIKQDGGGPGLRGRLLPEPGVLLAEHGPPLLRGGHNRRGRAAVAHVVQPGRPSPS